MIGVCDGGVIGVDVIVSVEIEIEGCGEIEEIGVGGDDGFGVD